MEPSSRLTATTASSNRAPCWYMMTASLPSAPTPPGARYVDANAGLIMPGLLCTHTHFYGAFARGMTIPGEPPRNFPEILERLWWRLDKLLTLEDIRASAEIFMVDAICHGRTRVVDHHASPNAV